MADVITRFKLETTQYDSKLRDAAKGLKDFTHQAEFAGSKFGEFTQKNVEVARSFGDIATSATNTKDKVKELVDAYNQVAKAYNALTKEQQQSDYGKAMADSLNTLQGRIKEAKEEMNSTGGVLSQLKDKFTVNIDALKLFNVGVQAAESALGFAKDAFFKNEQQLDEWGRIVESSHSLYEGFLSALNNGDISGYLNNITNITNAARNAYDALDALSTFNAFNQVNVEKTRTGMTESIVDYREGNATKETVKAAGEAYKKELEERRKLEKEAYLAKIREVAAERGVSGDDLIKALSGTYGSYQALKNMPLSGTKTVFYGGGMFGGGGSYQKEVANSPQERLGQALRQLNDTELQSLQALGAQAERTGNEIAQVDRQLSRVLNGRQGSGGGGGRSGGGGGKTTVKQQTELQQNQTRINDLTQEYVDISGDATEEVVARQEAIREEIRLLEQRNNLLRLYAEQARGKLLGGKAVSDVSLLTMGNDQAGQLASKDYMNVSKFGLGKDFEKLPTQQIENMTDALKEQRMAFNLAGQAATNFGAALSGIDDPGAKAAGTVVSAISSIALGFAMASSNANTAGTGWGWLAWLAAGMSAMATTIATIHSLTGYAQGGIVKGNSYSGDNMMFGGDGLYGLNAGELVLTKAQQGNLANAIEGNGIGNLNLHGVLQGENILISIDRTLQRQGRELAVWGRGGNG